MDLSKGEKRENMKQATKKSLWQYDTENGDDAYSIMTDHGLEYIKTLAESQIENYVLFEKVNAFVIKCKFKSYRVKTLNNDYLDEFRAEEVWGYRLEQIEKIKEDLEEEKENNRVFKGRSILERRNRSDTITSLKQESSVEMLNNIDNIYDEILCSNSKNMNNKHPDSKDVDLIQKLKEDFVNQALNEKHNYPHDLPWDCYIRCCTVPRKNRIL